MKTRTLAATTLAIMGLCMAGAAGAQTGEGQTARQNTSITTAANTTDSATSRLSALRLELQLAQQKLSRAKALYDTGTATAGAYQDVKADVERLELAVAEAQDAARKQEQASRLLQPITVRFQSATIKQAAESLSKAANLPIHVSATVPEDARLNLTAKAVPLRNVLEALARNLTLRIEPTQDGGVDLQNWPELEINGTKQVIADASPWSSSWGPGFFMNGYVSSKEATGNVIGTISTRQNGSVRSSQNLSQAAGTNTISGPPNNNALNLVTGSLAMKPNPANSQAQFRNSTNSLLHGVNVTSVGNCVVVAEPGRGPQGEPGAWLTVYRLNGVNLLKETATFHPTRATLISPAELTPQSNFFNQSPQNRQSGQTRGSNRNNK